MKDKFYTLTRDNVTDDRPAISGPFETLAAAKEVAMDYEFQEGRIFTIITLDSLGIAKHISSATSTAFVVWK